VKKRTAMLGAAQVLSETSNRYGVRHSCIRKAAVGPICTRGRKFALLAPQSDLRGVL
jgi:hypothetical protein